MVTSNATSQSLTLNFHVEVSVPNYSDTPILHPCRFIYLHHHTYVNLRELFDKQSAVISAVHHCTCILIKFTILIHTSQQANTIIFNNSRILAWYALTIRFHIFIMNMWEYQHSDHVYFHSIDSNWMGEENKEQEVERYRQNPWPLSCERWRQRPTGAPVLCIVTSSQSYARCCWEFSAIQRSTPTSTVRGKSLIRSQATGYIDIQQQEIRQFWTWTSFDLPKHGIRYKFKGKT
jgi:hypothetical protein